MARAPRQFIPGGMYHVFSRGSNRQAIFLFDTDRTDFLLCLRGVVASAQLCCLSYCLMSNHYHLVVETPDGELSRAMRVLNGRYSIRFNRRYERDAHLFKNRFGAVPLKSESQLLWALRYVVENPVRNGLCGSPEEWRWSSYRAAVGLDPAPTFVHIERLLSYFGDTTDRARQSYRMFVDGFVGPPAVSDTVG